MMIDGLTANKVKSGVESSRWECPRDPGYGARGVTLFQEPKKCETLVLESFGSIHSCVYTWVRSTKFSTMCVYTHMLDLLCVYTHLLDLLCVCTSR
jgi:hypothetical protein